MHTSRRALSTAAGFLALATLTAAHTLAVAEEWWRFRGPNGAGISDATGIPVQFSPGDNELWSTDVPAGRSSPILVDDLVLITATDGDRLLTMALDRTDGSLVWQRAIERLRHDGLYRQNDSASPTPASNGEAIFVFFTEFGLVSYDLEGNERWRAELGPFANFYGVTASPLVSGEQVLLLIDQAGGSYLLSLDQATGAERWRAARQGRIESWTTPVLYPSAADPTQVLVFGSAWVDAYDLRTGEPAWKLPGLGAGPVASPVIAGSRLFTVAPNHAEQPPPSFASMAANADTDRDGRLSESEFAVIEGFGEHFGWIDRDDDGYLTEEEYDGLMEMAGVAGYGLVAVDLPAAGSTEKPAIAWSQKQSVGYISSPLVYDGVAYMIRDGGIVSSVDPATGEVYKRARFSRSAGQVFSSPVAADGKIFIGSLEGELAVLQAGADWEVLALNDLGAPIRGGPRNSDRLLRWDPDQEEGVWNATEETELSC